MPRLAEAGTPKVRPTPHHTVIESVSADSITITNANGNKTYKITPATEIMFKNQLTTVDKLQTGMRVQLTPDAVNEENAGKIEANDAPTPRPEKAKVIGGTPKK